MPAGRQQERRDSSQRPRSHHISSIAHLFLADDEKPLPPQIKRERVSFCVAGAQRSAVTALVASRLAGLAGGCGQTGKAADRAGRVLLWEDERTPWSYQGYLMGFRLRERAIGQLRLSSPLWPVQHWPFCTKAAEILPCDAAVSDLDSSPDAPEVVVQHLGHVDEGAIRQLRSCLVAPFQKNLRQENGSGRQNLIWCLVGDDSLSLMSCSRLGRLVDFLGVSRLFLLVFPDSWRSLGMPGLRTENSAASSAFSLDPQRALQLGQRVAPARQVAVLTIGDPPGAGSFAGLDEALTGILGPGIT